MKIMGEVERRNPRQLRRKKMVVHEIKTIEGSVKYVYVCKCNKTTFPELPYDLRPVSLDDCEKCGTFPFAVLVIERDSYSGSFRLLTP